MFRSRLVRPSGTAPLMASHRQGRPSLPSRCAAPRALMISNGRQLLRRQIGREMHKRDHVRGGGSLARSARVELCELRHDVATILFFGQPAADAGEQESQENVEFSGPRDVALIGMCTLEAMGVLFP